MAPRRVCLVRGIRVTGVGPQHAVIGVGAQGVCVVRVTGVGPQHAVCGASGTRDKA